MATHRRLDGERVFAHQRRPLPTRVRVRAEQPVHCGGTPCMMPSVIGSIRYDPEAEYYRISGTGDRGRP